MLALHAEARLELGGLLGEQGGLLLEGGGDPLVGGLPAGTGGTGADHVGEHDDGGRHDGERAARRAMVGMGRVCTGGVTATADPQVRGGSCGSPGRRTGLGRVPWVSATWILRMDEPGTGPGWPSRT